MGIPRAFRAAALLAALVLSPGGSMAQAPGPDEAARLIAEGHALANAGRFAEARQRFEQALALRERALGPDDPAVAESLRPLADLHRVQGQLADAEPLYRRALAILEAARTPDHPDVAAVLTPFALWHVVQGRFPEAEALLRRALEIRERALGNEHLATAAAAHDLGVVLKVQGRPGDAEPFYRRAVAVRERLLGPDHVAVAAALDGLAETTHAAGRLDEAEPHYRRALAILEGAGRADHPDVATVLTHFAAWHAAKARYPEAEAQLRRALGIRERALGADDLLTAATAHDLAIALDLQGRAADAERFYRRAVAVRVRLLGPDHAAVAAPLEGLARTTRAAGRPDEAEPLYRRLVEIVEKTRGPEHPDLIPALDVLAELYRDQAKHADAEAVLRRTLRIQEATLGSTHPDLAATLNKLGFVQAEQGRYVEAESLHGRSLELREKAFGVDDPQVGESLNNLAVVYRARGQYGDAETLLRRALAIQEKARGATHPDVALLLNNVGMILRQQGRSADAEPLYRRALAILETELGREHRVVVLAASNLGELLVADKRYAEAEPLLLRAVDLSEKAMGAGHPQAAFGLNNLAGLYLFQGRFADAEPLLHRALAALVPAYGEDHPHVAAVRINLAVTVDRLGQRARARALYERARQGLLAIGRANVDLDEVSRRRIVTDAAASLRAQAALLAAIAREPGTAPGDAPALQAFVVAEQARAGAVQAALAKAAARTATRDAATGQLARRVQDLRDRRQGLRTLLTTEYGKPAPERDEARVAALRQAAEAADRELADATGRLLQAFPRYAELAAPEPIEASGVQALLGPGEALVAYFALEDRLLAWLVRRDRPPVFRDIEVKRAELAARVTRVRRSLDQSLNPDLGAGHVAPFDVAGAHELYRVLIEPFASDLDGVSHLLVVPDETLLPLPFGVLVTRSEGEEYRQLAELHAASLVPSPAELPRYAGLDWLARRHAITVLPSATSLRALRQAGLVRGTPAESFIGLGDPVLSGAGHLRGGAMLAVRGAGALDVIRAMPRLPGTRDELRAIADALAADPGAALFLADRATVTEIRRLDRAGRLGRARVLAFATHGLLAGELTGVPQPALVLTPPAAATSDDDGVLTAEDVMGLSLPSTEWAVLSACNTAADDGSGEGLAGLARAFFFAGARALLVSHWSVDDRATQALMTAIFRRVAHAPGLTRAEAVRQGILEVMAAGQGATAHFAHPFAWAAFSLVGDGGG